ncbi:hypothetical protein N7490_002815 [Penicillium lividum]|nr:hypothetical protein N7490_002815 [Penicillium lividum]
MPSSKTPFPTRSNSSSSAASSSAGPSTEPSAGPSSARNSGPASGPGSGQRLHKRSRSGCFTCRLRRKKCDESHPACSACINLSVRCEYKRPIWWGSPDQRRLQKERIKNKIKQTKSLERSGAHHGRIITSPSPSESELTRDYSRPIGVDWDHFGPHFSQPGFVPITYANYTQYEIDVKTERQTFVNDVPTRHDTSTSTFSAMGPTQLHAPLPAFSEEEEEELFQEEYFDPSQNFQDFQDPSQSLQEPLDPSVLNQSVGQDISFVNQNIGQDPSFVSQSVGQSCSSLTANIPVTDWDRPLLDHFVENVLRMIFPILEIHQQGSTRTQEVLKSLETNKSYFHCCLSVSATHLKMTVDGLDAERIDEDIMRHRYEAVSELCKSLGSPNDHQQILDSTLAMIFFHCSVGAPDNHLPDIPWSEHFQAVTNLINKLDLTNAMVPCGSYMAPAFSMSLTSWIDILGATMLGKTPKFAHSHRTKHLSGTSSGLRELMGCDDRVMYLISEIACLEALKIENRITEITLCDHVALLGGQLDYTEPTDSALESPYSPNGSIRPDILTKNITALFRLGARILLCSLIPGSTRNHANIINLVDAVVDALSYIPAGIDGFDRSLVWPLLMAGAYSTPDSAFRGVLADRNILMGDVSDLGSFGRMYTLLVEYWRLTDDPAEMPVLGPVGSIYGVSTQESDASSSMPLPSPGLREIKRQQVHWRDVMKQNGWQYLLI